MGYVKPPPPGIRSTNLSTCSVSPVSSLLGRRMPQVESNGCTACSPVLCVSVAAGSCFMLFYGTVLNESLLCSKQIVSCGQPQFESKRSGTHFISSSFFGIWGTHILRCFSFRTIPVFSHDLHSCYLAKY